VDEQTTQLRLRVDAGPEADVDELDRLTRRLLRELAELDVTSAALATGGPAPAGARSAVAAQLGTILVRLVATPELLVAVVTAVQAWIAGRDRKVHLELDGDVLEVGGLSAAEQSRLAEAWLSRHGVAMVDGER
jgi:hypothetical protein